MGFISYKTKKVVLGKQDGVEWFVVLRELSQGDASRVEACLTRNVRANEQGGTLEEGAVGQWRIEQVARSIVEWNLTDEQERPLPTKPIQDLRKSLERLPLKVFNKLFEAAEDLNKEAEVDSDTIRFPDSTDGDNEGAESPSDGPRTESVSVTSVVQDRTGDEL